MLKRTPLGIPLLCPIGGAFSDLYTPPCLAGAGALIGAPIDPIPGREPDELVESFGEGAEFADVCRAMLVETEPFACYVRAANVPRLIVAARVLGCDLAVDPIPPKDDPLRLHGRISVSPPARRQGPHCLGPSPLQKFFDRYARHPVH